MTPREQAEALVVVVPMPRDTSDIHVGACYLAYGLSDRDARDCASELRKEIAAAIAAGAAEAVAAERQRAVALCERALASIRTQMPKNPYAASVARYLSIAIRDGVAPHALAEDPEEAPHG